MQMLGTTDTVFSTHGWVGLRGGGLHSWCAEYENGHGARGYAGLFSERHMHLVRGSMDIQFTELYAILVLLVLNADLLEGCRILVETDNE